ncbi:hypothetical protein [uncultured Microbacterium sp.]|uniref:hypothetical protein n=1 Tax=uncultured Microbacterium sp. TaxID=191216 RepID=UPI0035CBC1E0
MTEAPTQSPAPDPRPAPSPAAERGIWIDDEDEWAEHRVQYGYPLDLVTRLESLAIELKRSVTAREAPFDEVTGDAWLGVLAGLDLE